MRVRPPGPLEVRQGARLDLACRHPNEVLLHCGPPRQPAWPVPAAASPWQPASAIISAMAGRQARTAPGGATTRGYLCTCDGSDHRGVALSAAHAEMHTQGAGEYS